MRRSFRVASVFTGVAALAGGFAPAAFAAVQPDILPQECGANNGGISNWVHLYYPNDDHPAECFHGLGHTAAHGTIYSFCGGNNYGWLYGTADGGQDATFQFASGAGRRQISYYDLFGGNFTLSGITISGWTGDSKCT